MIHQNCRIWAVSSSDKFSTTLSDSAGKYYWLQVVRGSVSANGNSLSTGDGLGLAEIPELSLSIEKGSEFLLFEMWAS